MAGIWQLFKPKGRDPAGPDPSVANTPSSVVSFFGRKSAPAASPAANESTAPEKTERRIRKRKGEKDRSPVTPVLPDVSGPPPVVCELDSDGLLVAGRRKMAIGLLWQPRQMDQRLDQQARAASVGDNTFDLSALFSDGTQVGFASSMDAHAAGMVAAATAFPRALTGDTWLAAFVLPMAGEQMQAAWWIVACRDGLIYEDRILRNEIDARDAFIDLRDAPGWQQVICPSNWQVAGAAEVPLGFMLARSAKGAALKAHSPVRIWAPRVIAATVLIGALGGAYLYWQSMLEAQRQAEAEMLASQERARLAARQVPPWTGLPSLESFANSCAALINKALVQPPGWQLQPIECLAAPGQISIGVNWVKQPGARLVWLYGTLRNSALPAPQLDDTLSTATISLSAAIGPNEWNDVVPLDPALMVSLLAHRFDTLSLPLSLNGQPPEPAPSDVGNPNAPKWGFHLLEMSASTLLVSQIQLLADIPAVVPQSVTYDPAREVWSLKARIYHPPTRTS